MQFFVCRSSVFLRLQFLSDVHVFYCVRLEFGISIFVSSVVLRFGQKMDLITGNQFSRKHEYCADSFERPRLCLARLKRKLRISNSLNTYYTNLIKECAFARHDSQFYVMYYTYGVFRKKMSIDLIN